MGKSERNKAKDMTQENYSRATSQGTKNDEQFQGMLGEARGRATDAYDSASGGYKSFMGSTGSYDPDAYKKVSGQNDKNIATGGYDPEQLSKIRAQSQTNINTAGYQPGDVSKINANYDKLTANGMGGINEKSAGDIRAGYGTLAKTGGIDDPTADAMRRQTASGVASVYSTLGSNMVRKNAAQGFGGGGGETAQMARQLGNTQGEALTGVNAEIGKLRQTGTIAGLGGLSEFEQGAAGGQRAAVAGQSQFAGDQARNVITASGQAADIEANKAKGTLQASGAEQDLATGAAQQRIASAGGMAQLYSADPGYVTNMVKSILDSQQTTGNLTSQQAQIMEELSKQPGLFQNIMQGITTIGGAAAGVMGGLGGIGMKPLAGGRK